MRRYHTSILDYTLSPYDISDHCTYPKFLRLIEAAIAVVPEGERDKITVRWSSSEDCYIEFNYSREETDEEMAARIESERAARGAAKKRLEQSERATLAALKAKYENPK